MAIVEFVTTVNNPDAVSLLYDRIQVWRSPDESGSPTAYIEITASDDLPAILDGSVADSWNLNGETLTLVLDGGSPININFSGTNPFILQTVLSTINSVVPGLAIEVPFDTNKIRLTSLITGTGSAITASGTAAATLGLSTIKVNGKTGRPILSSNIEDYTFFDLDGAGALWYKTRYYSSVTGAVSAFSDPFLGGIGTGLPDSVIVTGKIAMADSTGAPIVGRRIIFVPVGSQVVPDGGGNNYGVFPSVDRLIATTDLNGRASIDLVKGQRLKVFLEGTTFQREFIVPSADFDILTVASTQPDPFDIVTTPPLPIRMS